MEELVQLGNEIIICPLRPPKKTKGPSGLKVSSAQVLRSPLTPWAWLAAQTWLLWRRPAAWRACWRDVLSGIRQVSRLHHLLYILLVTTWLARYLQNREVDHIRGHFLHSEALSCMWLSRMLGVSYSLTAHVKSIRFPRHLIAKAAREAAFLIADTGEVYELLKQMRTQEIYLIRNGLNLQNFPFRGFRSPSSETPVILAIGWFVDPKGFDVLIQACAHLHRQSIPFMCRIIGDGEERPRLERLVQELGLEGASQMPGALPYEQLKTEYAGATVFVMPSKDSSHGSDGLPTVLIEAMALGVPVVATRKAGIPDLVKNGETGVLVEPNDPDSLAAGLARLLGDVELQNRLSLAGRELVKQEYDIHKSAAQLLHLITTHS
jgi:glycosyltransferase involved in cell wall biosynthesis